MYPLIRLSRLELLNNYHEVIHNCPTFVLLFLADTLAIRYNPSKHSIEDLISTINRLSGNQPYLEEDNLEGLARFVNTNCSWDEESLLLAFKDAYNFTPQIPIVAVRKFGSKTPDSPLNIDAFMAYQICVKYNIPTTRYTSFEKVQSLIQEWSVRATPLRLSIFQKLKLLSRQKLLAVKSSFCHESEDSSIDAFLESIKNVDPKKDALEKIARYYRLDASESKNPVEELLSLERTESEFVPIDSEWREKYLVNPDYYCIDSRYISEYDTLYNQRNKKHLLYLSGYDIGNLKTSTLVLGIHPRIPSEFQKQTQILLEEIPECRMERLKRFISSEEYNLVFTREELCEHFNTRKDFTIPNDSSKEFSEVDLNMIIRNSTGHPIVKIISQIKDSRLRDVNMTVESLSLFKTDFPAKLLQSLEQLGFVMRGWKTVFGLGAKEASDLPVGSSVYDFEHQESVENLSIIKILELLQDQKYSFILSSIPLMILRNVDSERVIVPYGGSLKVKDRLNLIVTDNKDEHSCIRTNSNMILATAYFFMQKTNICEPMFDINELRCIS